MVLKIGSDGYTVIDTHVGYITNGPEFNRLYDRLYISHEDGYDVGNNDSNAQVGDFYPYGQLYVKQNLSTYGTFAFKKGETLLGEDSDYNLGINGRSCFALTKIESGTYFETTFDSDFVAKFSHYGPFDNYKGGWAGFTCFNNAIGDSTDNVNSRPPISNFFEDQDVRPSLFYLAVHNNTKEDILFSLTEHWTNEERFSRKPPVDNNGYHAEMRERPRVWGKPNVKSGAKVYPPNYIKRGERNPRAKYYYPTAGLQGPAIATLNRHTTGLVERIGTYGAEQSSFQVAHMRFW